jgi:hypothetical protein
VDRSTAEPPPKQARLTAGRPPSTAVPSAVALDARLDAGLLLGLLEGWRVDVHLRVGGGQVVRRCSP